MNLNEYKAIKRFVDLVSLSLDYLPERHFDELVKVLEPVEEILNSYPHYEKPELGYTAVNLCHDMMDGLGISKAAQFNRNTETLLDELENMNTVLGKRQLDLKCDDCGISSMDVIETICPYNQDLYGEEFPATLCVTCFNTRCDDI